jgi:hypothetical protein
MNADIIMLWLNQLDPAISGALFVWQSGCCVVAILA